LVNFNLTLRDERIRRITLPPLPLHVIIVRRQHSGSADHITGNEPKGNGSNGTVSSGVETTPLAVNTGLVYEDTRFWNVPQQKHKNPTILKERGPHW
jgi:hypothetical protein